MIDTGALDRRISIQRTTVANDAFNEPIGTWAELASVWAMVVPVSDGERLRAGESLATRSSRFTIRHSTVVATVDPRDRIVFDGRTYDINGVKEIGRREGIEITATARAEAP